MTKIKIYSYTKPAKINGHLETYNISEGVKGSSMWYSEVNTIDYDTVRAELEKEGYTAHPSDSTEIESSIYTIFKETVIPI